jgi:hypothetical protein
MTRVSLKKMPFVTIFCLFTLFLFVQTVQAEKSVFIISKCGAPSKAQAYRIERDHVSYEDSVNIDTYNQGYGAVGLAVWPEKELMFVTYEESPMIVWASTKTLEKVGEFDTGVLDLSGIAVDEDKQKIYVVRRGFDDLYVYSFDGVNNTLVLDSHRDLLVPSGVLAAWGIALDETNGWLYVSTSTERVHVYRTSDWSHHHYIDIKVGSTYRSAVGIAVDEIHGYLYTGHWQDHNYLVRTNTSSPYNSIEVEITRPGYYSQRLIGVDVDDETGLVYCTTYHNDFRVYDSALVLKDAERHPDISGPAGVAVGGWYKASEFVLNKQNADPQDLCVKPFIGMGIEDNYLVFNICWDANSQPDTAVKLIDYLPKEVGYDSSTPVGQYNPDDRTVTWDLGDLLGNEAACYELKTKVNNWARPGGTFTNSVVMEGNLYHNVAQKQCHVCNWGTEIIYVDKDATGYNNGTCWDNAYTDLQDAFTGARACGAEVTAIWVAAGTYKPISQTDPQGNYKDASFELIEGVGVFGHFGGVGVYESSPCQRNLDDPANETILEGQIGANYYEAVKHVVTATGIESAVLDGFTIQNSFGGSGVSVDNSDVGIVNCKLKDNNWYGIEVFNYAWPDIHNCTFVANTVNGIMIDDHCWPEVSACTFNGNNTTVCGLTHSYYSVVSIADCLFEAHTGYAVSASQGSLTVTDCEFDNNDYGLVLGDVTTTIDGCSITGCGAIGVQCSNSDLTVRRSTITGSTYGGILAADGSNLTLEQSIVAHSGQRGIELRDNLVTTITNNWICHNGGAGIYFVNQSSVPLVRNNTIYGNLTYGLESSGPGADPQVLNCIIRNNQSGDFFRQGGSFNNVNFCCLSQSHAGTGNIVADPVFVNPADPDDLHIDETSPCKDAGDPDGSYGDEEDIDGEDRIVSGRVDMGADEYYWSPSDFDHSGSVNFSDYAVLANSWQAQAGDYEELAMFCEDWLWEFAAAGSYGMMSAGSGADSSIAVLESETLLMLPDAAASLEARPARLAARSQKFYDITPAVTISALQQAAETERDTIEETIKWLDGLWSDGELSKIMTEQEYQQFKKSVQESVE